MNSITLALENMRYGALQLSVCISDALQAEVMVSKKAVFQVRYLSGQVAMGSKGALNKAARTNSRHHMGVIIWGMPLECSRPVIRLLSVGSMLRELPWIIACLSKITATYRFMVFTASVSDLVCKKSRT